MNRTMTAIITCLLLSPSAKAGESYSSDSATWEDNYAKGRSALNAREYADAETHLEKAKDVFKNITPGDSRLAATSAELLILDDRRNDRVKAIAHLTQQRDAYIKAFGPTYCQVGATDETLATQYLEQGNAVEAEKLYKTAMVIIEQAFGSGSLKLAEIYHNCAVAQWRMGKPNEALQTIRKEEIILQKSGANCDQKRIGSLMMQADILESLNKPKEAQEAWNKYYSLMAKTNTQ